MIRKLNVHMITALQVRPTKPPGTLTHMETLIQRVEVSNVDCAICRADRPLSSALSKEFLTIQYMLNATGFLDDCDGKDASLSPHHQYI